MECQYITYFFYCGFGSVSEAELNEATNNCNNSDDEDDHVPDVTGNNPLHDFEPEVATEVNEKPTDVADDSTVASSDDGSIVHLTEMKNTPASRNSHYSPKRGSAAADNVDSGNGATQTEFSRDWWQMDTFESPKSGDLLRDAATSKFDSSYENCSDVVSQDNITAHDSCGAKDDSMSKAVSSERLDRVSSTLSVKSAMTSASSMQREPCRDSQRSVKWAECSDSDSIELGVDGNMAPVVNGYNSEADVTEDDDSYYNHCEDDDYSTLIMNDIEKEESLESRHHKGVDGETGSRLWAISTLKPLLWKLLARVRLNLKLRCAPHVATVTVVGAMGIRVSDISASNPYVIVHCQKTQHCGVRYSIDDNNAGTECDYSNCNDNDVVNSHTSSLYRGQIIHSTVNPVWNEDCLVPGLTFQDTIGVTVVCSNANKPHRFLGQILLPLRDYPQLFRGEEVKLSLQPLNSYEQIITQPNAPPPAIITHTGRTKGLKHNGNNANADRSSNNSKNEELSRHHAQPLELLDTQLPGQGSVFVNIKLHSHTYTHCGWLAKQTNAQRTSPFGRNAGTYNSCYCVLTRDSFLVFDNAHSLTQTPVASMQCCEIRELNYSPDPKNGLEIVTVSAGREKWRLHPVLGEKAHSMHAWLRKLMYNCPNIQTGNAATLKRQLMR